MKDAISEPARLRDQHDQPDLVERIAGQAARDSAEPEELTAIAMARISARIDARTGKEHRPPPLGWVLAIGAFLLGIVTAASAAHLDLLPGWLTRTAPGPARHSSSQGTPAPRRAPAGTNAPTSAVAKPQAPAVATPAVRPAPAPDEEVQPPPDLRAQATRPAATSMPSHQVSGGGPRKPEQVAMLAEGPTLPSVAVAPPPRMAEPADPAAAGGLIGERAEAAGRPPWPSAKPPDPPGPSAALPGSRPDSTSPSTFSAKAPSGSSRATAAGSSAGWPALPAREPAPASPPQTADLLKEIVRALRVDHAPNRALALLDKHKSALAGQAFAEESLLLRVEAMLALGERTAVLRLLDRTSLTDLAVSSALLITRGELRAAANRCAEGVGDFDLVLAESRRPPKQALLGRARCKQRLGDLAGAQADFERYRREFPDDPPH